MAEEREQVMPAELVRWVVLGVVVLAGLALYLVLGDEIEPVARPVVLEERS